MHAKLAGISRRRLPRVLRVQPVNSKTKLGRLHVNPARRVVTKTKRDKGLTKSEERVVSSVNLESIIQTLVLVIVSIVRLDGEQIMA